MLVWEYNHCTLNIEWISLYTLYTPGYSSKAPKTASPRHCLLMKLQSEEAFGVIVHLPDPPLVVLFTASSTRIIHTDEGIHITYVYIQYMNHFWLSKSCEKAGTFSDGNKHGDNEQMLSSVVWTSFTLAFRIPKSSNESFLSTDHGFESANIDVVMFHDGTFLKFKPLPEKKCISL